MTIHRSLHPVTGIMSQIAAMGRQLGKTRMLNVRVVAPPTRNYRGKQARRAAFYHRQRCARLLRRIVCAVEWPGADLSDHLRDALMYGMSALKVERKVPIIETWDKAAPGGDRTVRAQYRQNPDGTRTLLRVDEFEPSPVFHFKRLSYDDFAKGFEPPDA